MSQFINHSQVKDDSQRVAKSFDTNFFSSAAGYFVGQLMWLATNGSWQVIDDGIVEAWKKRSRRQIECAGVFTSLDEHFVWPVKVQFCLNDKASDIASGLVKFGSCSWVPRVYGSVEHKELMEKIEADEDFETDWMRIFRLESNGWSVELPELMEIV